VTDQQRSEGDRRPGIVAAKKNTKITIESETVLLIRRDGLPEIWCSGCSGQAKAIALDTLRVMANVSASVIEHCLQPEEFHIYEAPNGERMVCLNSLLRSLFKE